jgi:hypothetical protein
MKEVNEYVNKLARLEKTRDSVGHDSESRASTAVRGGVGYNDDPRRSAMERRSKESLAEERQTIGMFY